MFRTNNLRGEVRWQTLRNLTGSRPAQIKLTAAQLSLIETTALLTLAEKIELLLVVLGNKLTTEIQLGERSAEEIKQFLSQLPLLYYFDQIERISKRTGQAQVVQWFQVCLNEAVSVFIRNFSNDLTEFEEGILYGYPLSAIRAFAGLIESKHQVSNAATFFLAGVGSQQFWADEQVYYQLWWDRLKQLAPAVVAQAEQAYAISRSEKKS